MQQSTGSGPSTATIAGISIGILAGVFVILGAMLIWRKRSQRRENFDLFYGGTLAAASGFPSGSDGTGTGAGASSSAEPPIYGRSAPEEEKYEMNGGAAPSRAVSSNAPRRSRSHTSNHNRSPMPASAPPPLMPMHPLPTAATGHDASYQQHQDSYYTNQQYHQHQLQYQPQHQDYYASQHQHQHQYQKPPQQKPSYSLPRHHPAFDNEYEHQFGQR
ncbi:MAG: hypothetical protein JOS17DRAFT_753478 [Linnemannia elongata]|nr:MAG: hypothetical protein JOS17DRAFT_753478 [Linnemannia elongata]